MFTRPPESDSTLTDELHRRDYWPAVAAKHLAEGQYSEAVQVCRSRLADEPDVLSGRVIYARALFHTGQIETAAEQFHQVLAADPENIAALKYLGDIEFAQGDELAALSYYDQVLQIDPQTDTLRLDLKLPQPESTRKLTLKHPSETTEASPYSLRPDVYFYTETVGDLYFAQGHMSRAVEVYRHLCQHSGHPRLIRKLSQAERRIRDKERKHVSETPCRLTEETESQ
jgi:tetratricopeptide (TPR) repeat protein